MNFCLLCIPFYSVVQRYIYYRLRYGNDRRRHGILRAMPELKCNTMIRWTVIFLIIAIIAAIFGFGGIAAGAAYFAKIIFFIAVVIFLVSLIAGATRKN